jgi:alpha-beta hydrolase superfamily lysophospholipase
MRHPVVFIHGRWLHASSWDRWVTLFGDHGHAAVAPGWPGDGPTVEATRKNSGPSACAGVSEVTEHYARIAGELPTRPVLIGHGLGGLLALTLSPQTHAAGVIAIEPLLLSATALTRQPGPGPARAALSRDQFRDVYGSTLSREESDRLYERWAIPTPPWALSDPATPAPLTPGPDEHATNSSRCPVLLVASGQSERQRAARLACGERRLLLAGGDLVVFPDRGPSLIIDSGWRPVAEACLSWMDAYEL